MFITKFYTALAQIKPSIITPDADPYVQTGKIISTVTTALITVATIYFLVYFLLGGINFITSEGDKAMLETAKKQLTYAFLGLVVVLSVFAVIRIVGYIFGIPGLEGLQVSF